MISSETIWTPDLHSRLCLDICVHICYVFMRSRIAPRGLDGVKRFAVHGISFLGPLDAPVLREVYTNPLPLS
jgi:hypothetical protein